MAPNANARVDASSKFDATSGGGSGACDACTPIELAHDVFGPQGVVAAAGHVYWTNLDGTITRCKLEECGRRSEVFYEDVDSQGVAYSLIALAADDEFLYWGRIESLSRDIGSVVSCPLSGCKGGVKVLARSTMYGLIGDVAVYQDALFWTSYTSAPVHGAVSTCDKNNCEATRRDIATGQRDPVSIIASSRGVYWTNANALIKCTTPRCTEPPELLVNGLARPIGLAADDEYVYFAISHAGEIVRCKHEGCGRGPEVIATGQSSPTQIVLDQDDVFWVNQGANTRDGTVSRCRKNDCSPTVIATAQNGPIDIALIDDRVFWVNVGTKPKLDGGSAMMVRASCRADASATECGP